MFSQHVVVVRLGCGRLWCGCSSEKSSVERFCNRPGDRVLHGKNVVHRGVICIGPEVRVGLNINELRCDTESVAGFADASFKNMFDVEFRSDGFDVGVCSLE